MLKYRYLRRECMVAPDNPVRFAAVFDRPTRLGSFVRVTPVPRFYWYLE